MVTFKTLLSDQKLLRSPAAAIIFLLIYIVNHLVLSRFGIIQGVAGLIFQLCSYLLLALGSLWLFRGEIGRGLEDWRRQPAQSTCWLWGTFAAGLLLENIAVIPAALLGVQELGDNGTGIIMAQASLPPALIILGLGIAGPLVEEMIYRVLLLERTQRYLPRLLCLLISSLLFMLVHLHSYSLLKLAGGLPYLAIAFVYGFSYQRRKNITIPILLHVLNNVLALLLMM